MSEQYPGRPQPSPGSRKLTWLYLVWTTLFTIGVVVLIAITVL